MFKYSLSRFDNCYQCYIFENISPLALNGNDEYILIIFFDLLLPTVFHPGHGFKLLILREILIQQSSTVITAGDVQIIIASDQHGGILNVVRQVTEYTGRVLLARAHLVTALPVHLQHLYA